MNRNKRIEQLEGLTANRKDNINLATLSVAELRQLVNIQDKAKTNGSASLSADDLATLEHIKRKVN